MPKFYYRARDKKGGVIEGAIEAADPWLARKALMKLNLIVLEVNRFNWSSVKDVLKVIAARFVKKMTVEEKLIFVSQLETGYSVGIPIIRILEMIRDEITHPQLKEAVTEMARDIAEGSTLHQAFSKHPQFFDPIFVSMVRTGELAGQLEQTLGRVIKLTEQQALNQAKVKSAMFYPKIVVGFMVVVVGVVVYVVVPKLKVFLQSLGTDLPPITQFVVGTSDFFVHNWYLVAAAGIGLKQLWNYIVSTPQGKLITDRIKLKLPIFGILITQLELNNFCVMLELLMGSGIPLTEGLEILAQSQTNQVFKDAIVHCRSEIEKGGSLTRGISDSPVFPSSFKGLISIGEESGSLPNILKRMGKHYQTQVDYRLENLSKLIEPVLLAVIFGMVTVLALAIFLPIWKMSSAQRPGR
jgi:MSHA biogenesis protein MshG